MDGSTQLTARLSRRYDARGREIELPASLTGQPENLAVVDICTWHSRGALHEAMMDVLPPGVDLTNAAGVVTITADVIRSLLRILQQPHLGLPDPERQETRIVLLEALQDLDPARSPVFEYSWTAEL